METEKFATELLHELKQTSKRWFIAFLTVLVLWFATIGVFIWYISLPVEEYDTYISQDADNHSYNISGGDYYGSASNSQENIQTQSE